MESAAREMNLSDIANRIEKIIGDACENRNRITEAGDILMGGQPVSETNGTNTPSPSALLHRIGQQLGILESIMNGQRQELHRLHSGLREAPPNKALGGLPRGDYENQQRAAYDASRSLR
jgi:hypothetical protein